MFGDYFKNKLSLSDKEPKGDQPETIQRENRSASFISLDNDMQNSEDSPIPKTSQNIQKAKSLLIGKAKVDREETIKIQEDSTLDQNPIGLLTKTLSHKYEE